MIDGDYALQMQSITFLETSMQRALVQKHYKVIIYNLKCECMIEINKTKYKLWWKIINNCSFRLVAGCVRLFIHFQSEQLSNTLTYRSDSFVRDWFCAGNCLFDFVISYLLSAQLSPPNQHNSIRYEHKHTTKRNKLTQTQKYTKINEQSLLSLETPCSCVCV